MLFSIAKLTEAKDPSTGDHCARLAYTSQVFGAELGLSRLDIDALRKGGILHDIGKLGIPDKILLKEGPLDDAEWKIMREHSNIGAAICSSLHSMQRTIPIIKHHHERWDGTGYPEGLKGENIPLLARVFQIVDIYDALANERPYKKAFAKDEIIKILSSELDKGWRDPELTLKFIKILKTKPECLQFKKTNPINSSDKYLDEVIHKKFYE